MGDGGVQEHRDEVAAVRHAEHGHVIHPRRTQHDGVRVDRENAVFHFQLLFGVEICGRNVVFRKRLIALCAAVHLIGAEQHELRTVCGFGQILRHQNVCVVRAFRVFGARTDVRDCRGVKDGVRLHGVDEAVDILFFRPAQRRRTNNGRRRTDACPYKAICAGQQNFHDKLLPGFKNDPTKLPGRLDAK